MEYFTKEELRSLKQNVLKLHALPDNNVRVLILSLYQYHLLD
jgi:hypothetical protein